MVAARRAPALTLRVSACLAASACAGHVGGGAVDERAGNNILALGVGVAVFWPALFAMRPAGLEAAELARQGTLL